MCCKVLAYFVHILRSVNFKMKTKIVALTVVVLLLSTLVACQQTARLNGVWVDDTGYYIEFDDSTYRESKYGLDLPYEFSSGQLVYYWADGEPRTTDVTLDGDTLKLSINDSLRTFRKTNKSPKMYEWSSEEVSRDYDIIGSYNLISKNTSASSITLFRGNHISIAGGTFDENSGDIRIASEDVVIGKYAPDTESSDLYVYTSATGENSQELYCSTFKYFSEGDYIAAGVLNGTADNINTHKNVDPSAWSYTLSGSFIDDASGLTYTFNTDNTVIKSDSYGMLLNYAYYVDSNGLVSLSCLDGSLDTDFLFLDTSKGKLYRMVYQRDTWVDYIHELSASGVTYSSTGEIQKESLLDSCFSIVDKDKIVGADVKYIIVTNTTIEMPIMSLLNRMLELDKDGFQKDISSVQDQEVLLNLQQESKEQLEAEREKAKDEFLQKMKELAIQKELLEENAAEDNKYQYDASSGNGFYDPNVGYYEYIDGSDSEYVIHPRPSQVIETPTQQIEEDQENGVIVNPDNDGTTQDIQINFVCNCQECRIDNSIVNKDNTDIVLADPNTYTPGDFIVIEIGSETKTVKVVDSNGTITGRSLSYWSTDHDWVTNQKSGLYKVTQAVG